MSLRSPLVLSALLLSMAGCGVPVTAPSDRATGEVEQGTGDHGAKTHKIAVILGRFPKHPVEQLQKEAFDVAVAEAAQRLRTYSRGKFELVHEGTFGWFDLDTTYPEPLFDEELNAEVVHCPASAAMDDAARKAAEGGIDVKNYDYVVYGFAWGHCTITAGQSHGSGNVVVRADAEVFQDIDTSTIVHEIGHDLGLPHANGIKCFENGNPVPTSDDCEEHTYQDFADTMGQGGAQFNGFFSRQLGWLPESRVFREEGSFQTELSPLESEDPHNFQLLVIPFLGDDELGIEYRVPAEGAEHRPGEPVPGGVYLRLRSKLYSNPEAETFDSYEATRCIDTTPDDRKFWESFEDAALAPGKSFTDERIGLTVTNLGKRGSGVDIRVLWD